MRSPDHPRLSLPTKTRLSGMGAFFISTTEYTVEYTKSNLGAHAKFSFSKNIWLECPDIKIGKVAGSSPALATNKDKAFRNGSLFYFYHRIHS
jgi:hypothetical protein